MAKIVATLLWAILIVVTVGCEDVPPPPDWTKNSADQTAPVLTRAEKEHVARDVFSRIDHVAYLPKEARDQLGAMADPGRDWSVGCTGSGPKRRLIFAGMADDRLLIYFEQGGIAHSWMVSVFSVSGDKTVFRGSAYVGPDIHNLEELKKAFTESKLD